jgi:hypothetical protein
MGEVNFDAYKFDLIQNGIDGGGSLKKINKNPHSSNQTGLLGVFKIWKPNPDIMEFDVEFKAQNIIVS